MAAEVTQGGAYLITRDEEVLTVQAAGAYAIVGTKDGVTVRQAGAYAVLTPFIGAAVSQGSLIVVFEPEVIPEPDYTLEEYEATGDDQTLIVPADVDSVRVYLWGASGGAGCGYSNAGTLLSGGGAYVQCDFAVEEDDEIVIQVGVGGGGGLRSDEQVGEDGWPLEGEGTYDLAHESFSGGIGGSSRVYLNGILMAEAAGGLPSLGFPLGGSALGSNDTVNYASEECTGVQIIPSEGFASGGHSQPYYETYRGWGVLNPGPDSDTPVPGTDGRVVIRYVTP